MESLQHCIQVKKKEEKKKELLKELYPTFVEHNSSQRILKIINFSIEKRVHHVNIVSTHLSTLIEWK